MKGIFFLILILVSSAGYTECNFQTGKYINELGNPKYIRSINIDVPKSGKFNRNFAKILTSKSKNIPPKLKKSFKSILTVYYDFGFCKYKAKIKQNGDWKDHIKLTSGGKPVRSLNVKLKDGNILNSVKFKLLIPETRKDKEEVFGSVLLRNLGFIAPETFFVKTSVNNSESIMLFQEDAQKELIEKHNRREGPIFEGDEDLIWSFEDFSNGYLDKVSLSKVINDKWFLKGKTSELITLNAFDSLQKAYLDSSNDIVFSEKSVRKWAIFPNQRKNQQFEDFFLILLAMNGHHAFFLNNRRYYYNSFEQSFEPIYYDGDLIPDTDIQFSYSDLEKILKAGFYKGYKHKNFNSIFNKEFKARVSAQFNNRVLKNENELSDFLEKRFDQVLKNISLIQDRLTALNLRNFPEKIDHDENLKNYIKESLKKGLKQNIFISPENYKGAYKVTKIQGKSVNFNSKELAKILKNNKLDGMRSVLIPMKKKENESIDRSNNSIDADSSIVFMHSKGVNVDINYPNKHIIIKQEKSDDWILFKNSNLSEWRIVFHGTDKPYFGATNKQRFNAKGLTGCLNFYKVKFSGTNIKVNGGRCEDSINIVNSNGDISNLWIENAFSDAVDMDFSLISVDKIIVNNANNDCVDFSGGKYSINDALLSNCSDKAISLGEKSNLDINSISTKNSSISISSKDSSTLYVHSAKFKDTSVCIEAKQKKQEFGGAIVKVVKMECDGPIDFDKDSIITIQNI